MLKEKSYRKEKTQESNSFQQAFKRKQFKNRLDEDKYQGQPIQNKTQAQGEDDKIPMPLEQPLQFNKEQLKTGGQIILSNQRKQQIKIINKAYIINNQHEPMSIKIEKLLSHYREIESVKNSEFTLDKFQDLTSSQINQFDQQQFRYGKSDNLNGTEQNSIPKIGYKNNQWTQNNVTKTIAEDLAKFDVSQLPQDQRQKYYRSEHRENSLQQKSSNQLFQQILQKKELKRMQSDSIFDKFVKLEERIQLQKFIGKKQQPFTIQQVRQSEKILPSIKSKELKLPLIQ